MDSYEELYAYLPFFEQRSGSAPLSTAAGSPYSERMQAFMAAIEDTGFVDFEYHETLDRYGVAGGHGLAEALPSADPQLLRAAFTFMLHAERFSAGSWAWFEERGMFLAALRRLGEVFGYPPPRG